MAGVHAASAADGKRTLATAVFILVALVAIFVRSHYRTRRGSGGGSRRGNRGEGGNRCGGGNLAPGTGLGAG